MDEVGRAIEVREVGVAMEEIGRVVTIGRVGVEEVGVAGRVITIAGAGSGGVGGGGRGPGMNELSEARDRGTGGATTGTLVSIARGRYEVAAG